MGVEAERSARRWKLTAIVALLMAVGSLTGFITVAALPIRIWPQTDERLIGTWQSDADRTVTEWRERRPMTDEQTETLRRSIFGHLRVTYTRSEQAEEFQGKVTSAPYTVVGKDGTSVVIRARNSLSGDDELVHIHFIDADTYWVHAEISPLREYFRRVK